MALPSSIYRVNLQLSDVDRGVYETLQTTVARHPSETEDRLVARLLAYAIYFEPELVFTKGISAGDEPDLWLKGPDDRVQLWVEVGLPDADRIIKASRHAARVALVVCGRAISSWEQQQFPALARVPNLTVTGFEQAFITRLSARLERSVNWSITISDGTLYLNSADETLETTLQRLAG